MGSVGSRGDGTVKQAEKPMAGQHTDNVTTASAHGRTDALGVSGLPSKNKLPAAANKIFNTKKIMNIATWNIRSGSQTGKMDLLADELNKFDIDLATITEARLPGQGERTVFTSSHSTSFNLYYSGSESFNRGVAFMLKSSLKKYVTCFQPISDRIAILEFAGTIPTIAIGAYAPTETSDDADKDLFYENLQQVMDSYQGGNHLIILCGDLNAQTGSNRPGWENTLGPFGCGSLNDNGLRLLSFASFNRMVVCNTWFQHPIHHRHTWFSNNGRDKSMLDYFLVHKRFQSAIHDVRVMRGASIGSDHHLVRAKFRLHLKAANTTQPTATLDYTHLSDPNSQAKFQLLLQNRFAPLLADNADEQWNSTKNSIIDSLNEICPKKRRKIKPWISTNTLNLVEQRAQIKNINHKLYLYLNRQIKRQLKVDKEAWWNAKAQEMEVASKKHDSRLLYSILRSCNGKFKATSSNLKDHLGNPIKSLMGKLDRWKEHFSQLLNRPHPTSLDQDLMENADLQFPSAINDHPPAEEEIRAAIKRLKSRKAPGVDNIPAEALKAGGETIVKQLKCIYSAIWDQGSVPQDFKDSIIVPIHKKGDPANCKNYRGISLLSTSGKLLTSIIRSRLLNVRETSCREEQAGFRPGRGCTDQIFTLRQLVESRLRCKKDTFLVFVDFSCAFDSIDHSSLWCALKAESIPYATLNVLKAFYEGGMSRTKYLGNVSPPFSITTGVRQGCIISPMLFNTTMDWILRQTFKDTPGVQIGAQLFLTDLVYADDIVFFAETAQTAQNTLNALQTNANKLGLKINGEKTKFIFTGTQPAQLQLEGNPIERVDTFKYLGSIIDSQRVAATNDIQSRIGNAAAAFASLKKCLWSPTDVTIATKMRIFNASIRTVLLYGSESWTLLKSDLNLLERFQLRCLRNILHVTLRDRWKNESVLQLCADQTTVEVYLRRQRLGWFGHVCRMNNNRLPYRSINSLRPDGWKIARNAPKKTWITQVAHDLQPLHFSIPDAQQAALNRDQWRAVIRDVLPLAFTMQRSLPYGR